MTLVRKSLLLVIVVLLVLLVAAGAALAAKPTKVIIVTMDQMKPGYAKQFNMTNILWLQEPWRRFQERHGRADGLGDGGQSQHHRQRPAAQAHGLVG